MVSFLTIGVVWLNHHRAALLAAGEPVTGARLAEAAHVSPSYGRTLLAEFQADPTLTPAQANGRQPAEEVREP